MLVLYTQKEVLNKISKYLFSPTNVIFIYLSKTPKATKWGQQKNKPIKCSYVKKKMTSNLLKKIKHLFLPLNTNFSNGFFFIGVYMVKKGYIYIIQNVILSI